MQPLDLVFCFDLLYILISLVDVPAKISMDFYQVQGLARERYLGCSSQKAKTKCSKVRKKDHFKPTCIQKKCFWSLCFGSAQAEVFASLFKPKAQASSTYLSWLKKQIRIMSRLGGGMFVSNFEASSVSAFGSKPPRNRRALRGLRGAPLLGSPCQSWSLAICLEPRCKMAGSFQLVFSTHKPKVKLGENGLLTSANVVRIQTIQLVQLSKKYMHTYNIYIYKSIVYSADDIFRWIHFHIFCVARERDRAATSRLLWKPVVSFQVPWTE